MTMEINRPSGPERGIRATMVARATHPSGRGPAPGSARRLGTRVAAPPGEMPFMSEMPDVLKLHADGSSDKHAVIVDASHGARPSVTTFRELNDLVNRLVHGLQAAGVEQGDRLVWC